MTKRQNNQRAMLESVASLLETNAARTSSIPGISESVDRFNSLIEEIRNKTVEVGQATAGKTAAKWQAREELMLAVLQMSGAVHALACRRSDPELKAKSDIRESKLYNMRQMEFLSDAVSVLGLVQQNAEALGFSPEVIAGFEAKVEAYSSALGQSLSAVPGRIASRERMKDLMAEIDRVLGDEIDKYLEFFRTEAPEFYEAYFQARKIRKFGVRHINTEPEMIVPQQAPVAKAA